MTAHCPAPPRTRPPSAAYRRRTSRPRWPTTSASSSLVLGLELQRRTSLTLLRHAAARSRVAPDAAVSVQTGRADHPRGVTGAPSRVGDLQQPHCPGNAFKYLAGQTQWRSR
ncbi:MAG: hypothetical protein MZV70_41625 [Desulfobacterales bacterium]|nr:hypothetical protein [Desulfobacterales bacterium]